MAPDQSLRSRLRDALAGSALQGGKRDGQPSSPAREGPREWHYEFGDDRQARASGEQAAWIADALGGAWREAGGGVCLVIDRLYPSDRAHGQLEVGCYAETLTRCADSLLAYDRARSDPATPSLFSSSDLGLRTSDLGHRTSDDQRKFLFFDLETTGLSGGAGICAFLAGFGWFEGSSFRTRQYFLGGFGHERAMLSISSELLDEGVTLATFNGRTFDLPLIEGRYLFHRLVSPFDDVPHVDLLHPARRLWRFRAPTSDAADRAVLTTIDPERQRAYQGYFRSTELRSSRPSLALRTSGHALRAANLGASCALGVLEDAILGFRRTGDVPGGEIPSRYFHYVRTGDVRPLAPVLEHNRFDLLSLAAVAARVAEMLEEGPPAARNPHECLALGRLYERSGAAERAVACYERAGGPGECDRGEDVGGWVRCEALRRLAVQHRRAGRHDEAASAWQQLLDVVDREAEPARGGLVFEALHALAVHHEHRSRDLAAARAIVLRALAAAHPAHRDALQHRLARLDAKLHRHQS